MKNLYKILAMGMALIITVLSLAPARVLADSKTYNTPTFNYDNWLADTSNLIQMSLQIMELHDEIGDSSIYFDFTAMSQLAREYRNNYDDSYWCNEHQATYVQKVKNFLSWSLGKVVEFPQFLSVALRKVGVYIKDLQDFIDIIPENPENIIKLVHPLLKHSVEEEVDGTVTYVLSNEYVSTIKSIVDEYIHEEDDSKYFTVNSILWTDVLTYFEDMPSSIEGWLTTRLQNEYDKVANENYKEYWLFVVAGDIKKIELYKFTDAICAYGTSSGGTYGRNVLYGTSTGQARVYQYYQDYDWGEDYGDAITNDSYQVPHELTESFGRTYFNFGPISSDGHPVKIWKSRQAYLDSKDWSNGNPNNYITSDSYNNYETTNDNSITVRGDYVARANVENDYSTINENITTNNDYSEETINNIVNNYYINNFPQSVPDDQGEGNNGNGESGNGESGNGIIAFLEGIRSILNSVLELIGGILDIVGDLLHGLLSTLSAFTDFKDDFGDFLNANMEFIPEECIAIIIAGISAMVVIGVIKFIKG